MFHWRKNRMKKIRFESTILQKKRHFYSAEKQKTNQKQSNHFNFFSLDFFVPNFFHKKHSKKKKASPIFFLLFSDSVEDGGTAF